MRSDWKTRKLSEIAEFNPRETLPKGNIAKKVAMDKLQPFCRDIPSFELEKFSGGTKFRNGDTIMARITPCLENGKTAKVTILEDDEIGFGSTEYIVFRAKEGIDEDYLYYLVCSSEVRDPAIKSMVGSSGRQRVQTDVVKNIDIDVPPLEEQRIIGGILRDLDDKIQLNTEINKNLEQQAQAIITDTIGSYRISSIEDELSDLPLNWCYHTLESITEQVKPGTNYQPKRIDCGIPFLNVRCINNGYIDTSSAKLISEADYHKVHKTWQPEEHDILISRIGTLGLVAVIRKEDLPLAVHYNFIDIKTKSIPYEVMYFLLKSEVFQTAYHNLAKQSVQEYVTINEVASLKIPLPNDSTSIFEPLMSMYKIINNNLMENTRLIDLRNTLLPKLMSGELDISNLDL